MWMGPIVQEFRDAGAELAKIANYELHTLLNQQKRELRVWIRIK